MDCSVDVEAITPMNHFCGLRAQRNDLGLDTAYPLQDCDLLRPDIIRVDYAGAMRRGSLSYAVC